MGFNEDGNPAPFPEPSENTINIDYINWFHLNGDHLLADIVPDKVALKVPNFPRYDLDDESTWSMPIGEGDYFKVGARWGQVELEFAPGETLYETDLNFNTRQHEIRNLGVEGNQSFIRPRRRRTDASTSASAGPSSEQPGPPSFAQQSEVPHDTPWYQEQPYRNFFDPTYVPPYARQISEDLASFRTHVDRSFGQVNQRLDNIEQLYDRNNASLANQMENLSIQQRNYLDPMYVNQFGYEPPNYNYQYPAFPPPQDYTWDNRIHWPTPEWRPMPPPDQ